MISIPQLAFHATVTAASTGAALVAAVALASVAAVLARRARRSQRIVTALMELLPVAPLFMLAPATAIWFGSGVLAITTFAALTAALPAALGFLRPDPFGGLRGAASLALSTVALAELVGASKGLGSLVAFGYRQNNTALILVAVALLAAIGLAAYGAVAYAERCLVRRPKSGSHPDFIGA